MYPQIRLTPLFLSIFVFLVLFLQACSSSNSPVVPDNQTFNLPAIVSSPDARTAIAEYDLMIDPSSQTSSISPVERNLSAHMNLTQYFPNVVQVIGYGFTPSFWADIRLSHPAPGSGVTLYDPRVICITPAEPGVSFFYPVANALANHSAILQPDGYTPLFDNVVPAIKGNFNPFKAYFKTCPCREWASTGVTQETQRWYINTGGFGGPVNYRLVVDVSTGYPAPPQPYVQNAPEPVQISVTTGTGMTDAGGTAPVEVTLLDWQGRTGIGGVVCESPQLFNSVKFLSYFGPGTNPNEYVFKGNISNSKLAAAGDYKMLIGTWDSATMIALCVEVQVTVDSSTLSPPVEVTPKWLNYSPWDAAIDGSFAYIAAGKNGVHVFNVENMHNPIWINSVSINGNIERIIYWNGYAFAINKDGFLEIIDVNPPASASVVNTIPIENLMSVYASGNYLYAAAQDFFHIIDITSPETASIVKTVDPSPYANCVAVRNGYAFSGESGKFMVIDVDPPSSASVVKTITVPGSLYDIRFYGNYALCAAWQAGVVIVDITDPVNPVNYKSVATSNYIDRLEVSGGYAYTSGYNLEIIDIEPISSASVIKVVYQTTSLEGLAYSNGYVLGTDRNLGLASIDIEPPESAFLAHVTYNTSGSSDIETQGDYAFASSSNGLQVFDITPPESTTWMKTIADTGGTGSVQSSPGYVYLSRGWAIDIIDSDPIDTAGVINEIGFPNQIMDIEYGNGYVYAVTSTPNLSIVDVDPPAMASVINEVAATGYPQGMAYSNGYAYVSNSYDMFDIYDVDPVNTASRIKQVGPLQNSFDVDAANGIAVVADGSYLRIIDVDPPDTAYLVTSISMSWTNSVEISGGYAFVGNQDQFVAVDIDPPASASITYSYPMDGYVGRIHVNGRYAYICDQSHGIRILKIR